MRRNYLVGYAATVSVAGCALLVPLTLQVDTGRIAAAPTAFILLTAMLLAGELWPIRILRRGEVTSITTSTPFIFALLILYGTGAAAVPLVVSSLLADLHNRKSPMQMAFNAGQYTISLLCAGLTLALLPWGGQVEQQAMLAPTDVVAILLAGAVFFLVNHLLIGWVLAFAQQVKARQVILGSIREEVVSAGMLSAIAPIIVIVAIHGALAMPGLLLPAAAVRRSVRAQVEKEREARHDALTSLPNRTMFEDCVELAIEKQQTRGGQAAVLLVDLDHFKEVNDTLGHRIGDLLLRQVAGWLAEQVGEVGTVARLGGDEFAVLLPEVVSAEEALGVARHLARGHGEAFLIEEFHLAIEASIGVALFPDHGTDVETLVRHADVAMYLAKGAREGASLYEPERDQHSRRRLALTGQLRGAIDEGQLLLHYQPKVSLQTGETVGVEALVRWQHPAHGLIPPGEFLPLAERTVHMDRLTRFVLASALEQTQMWRAAGHDLDVAINISVQNLLDAGFPGTVLSMLARFGLPTNALQLEITESTIMSDPERATRALNELGAMGVRIAIDDFGTGYSSLAYLKQLPVDTLKIDRSFVRDVLADPEDAVIVQSIINLGRNLGLETVAEGIEHPEAYRFLHDLGCDQAQGFFIARPLPVEHLSQWLEVTDQRLPRLGAAGVPRLGVAR